MTEQARFEKTLLDSALAEFKAAGYRIVLRPDPGQLPEFLSAVRPDAIAVGHDPQWVIEVVHEERRSSEKTRRVQELLQSHPDWKLRLVLDRTTEPSDLVAASPDAIRATIETVVRLNAQGDRQAALLIAWSALEALGRRLEPEILRKPQSPGRLVDILARQGYVLPSEADQLANLALARNSLIHGQLMSPVPGDEIDAFSKVLDKLATNGAANDATPLPR